jgi:surfactin synthase thioesterase subunit
VELPGRNTRINEPKPSSMAELVEAMVEALAPLLPGRPFALFGHSMGAWVAFALAQELAARGLQLPLCLYVSGMRSATLAGMAHDVDGAQMHTLPAAEFWAAMERRYGRNPDLVRAPAASRRAGRVCTRPAALYVLGPQTPLGVHHSRGRSPIHCC